MLAFNECLSNFVKALAKLELSLAVFKLWTDLLKSHESVVEKLDVVFI